MSRLDSTRLFGSAGAILGMLLLWAPGPASAAPVVMNAELRIQMGGLGAVTLAGSGSVDVTGGVYSVPAALLAQTGPILVPVTMTTAVASLEAVGLSNLMGSLYAGGATAQAPGDVCAPGPGEACVAGGGIGGAMGINGLLNVNIIPTLVVFPFDLGGLQLGLGGGGSTPFTYDAAVWTTRTARYNTGVSTGTTQGSTTANGGLSLVTASFIAACGNVFPVFARFTLTPVVPEPSTVALLVVGLAGVATLYRRG